MDSKSSTKSSQNSLDPERSDRSSEEAVPSTPAVTNGTVEPSPARQPQNRVFTFFQRLPAELRLLIWEFACAPPGPRIHFLEPIDASYENLKFVYRSSGILDPEIHWQISEGTRDPCFQWSGPKLLSVCTEARKVLLNQQTMSLISSREQPRVASSVPTTDIICVRAGYATRGSVVYSKNLGSRFSARDTGYCPRDVRPSPRRLALEIPVAAESHWKYLRFDKLLPAWLGYCGRKQKFMLFDRLEVLYVLGRGIRPQAHFDHVRDMPPKMYDEAFDGHHGTKFVAIDPEDKQAVQLWIIPPQCWIVSRNLGGFPYFSSRNNHTIDNSPPMVKVKFLACVRKNSQTRQLDDRWPYSGCVFA